MVQRTTFAGGEGGASVNIKDSVVQHTEFKGDEGKKRREEEQKREEEKKKIASQNPIVSLTKREEIETARREGAEREREEVVRKEPEASSWKGFFVVALALVVLALGYWALAPGANDSPENSKLIPTSTPKLTPTVSPTSVAASSADQKTITNSIGMEFVSISSGEFNMGSPSNEAGRWDNEGPVHRVKIANAFYMGKYEVTQKQWRDVMGNNPSYFKGDNLPVEQVSWNDAQEFIKKLNEKESGNKYRLPTEAEWEYSARAGTTTRYSFGDEESKLGDYAWYDVNSGSKTHDVGQKKPNPWGLYDMHGNVWEWAQDSWHGDYNGAPTDGSAWEGDGSSRVVRGGSWDDPWSCRSAVRGSVGAGDRSFNVGFRLLRIL